MRYITITIFKGKQIWVQQTFFYMHRYIKTAFMYGKKGILWIIHCILNKNSNNIEEKNRFFLLNFSCSLKSYFIAEQNTRTHYVGKNNIKGESKENIH